MGRRSYFLLATVILCLLLGTQSAWASGEPPIGPYGNPPPPSFDVTGYSLTCTSLTVQGHSGASTVFLYLVNETSPTYSTSVPVSNGTYLITLTFALGSQNAYPGYFNFEVGGNVGPFFDIFAAANGCPASWGTLAGASGGASGGVTFFDPGDNRVDGHPWDRIAVWCNTSATPPNIVVYGIGDATNNSGGFWLGTFNNADLLKAGKAGIVKNAGPGNGSVSTATDGQGNFWSAWNGGIFNATGSPPFAKSYSCQF